MLEDEFKSLFGPAAFPAWSADQLYGLFQRHSATAAPPASPLERDRYARLLMWLVAQTFVRRRFSDSLPRAGVDPSDAASEILAHLLKKTPTIRIRVAEDASKPRRECVLALLSILHLAIYRLTMSLIAVRASKLRERCASDFIQVGKEAAPTSVLDRTAPLDQKDEEVAVATLARALDEAEDEVCGSVDGDIDDVVVLYRYICRLVKRGEPALTAYRRLPTRLLRRITPEQHALVLSRTRRVAEHCAAQL